jgi:hypothetical protein
VSAVAVAHTPGLRLGPALPDEMPLVRHGVADAGFADDGSRKRKHAFARTAAPVAAGAGLDFFAA